jgi:hypothetical protein
VTEDAAYRHYLADTVPLLKERALEAKAKRQESDFNAGRAVAYYEVLSMLRGQAEVFGLTLDEISLGDFDPDRDLLGSN